MNTSKDNVQLMIEAFTDFREGDDHSEAATDNLLRILLDHSVVPTYQSFDHREQRGRDFKSNPIADAERTEIDEMRKLLNGGGTGYTGTKIEGELWTSYNDLMALVITYPPVILEQLLVAGMVIYLLRADGIGFDIDTETFEEFYEGWGSVVCSQK